MGRILVVDDDTDARIMLGKLVDMTGHDIAFAANGWEALLVIDNGAVDLILLDVMMPGMDGATFLKILRNGKQKNIPVVVVTALDSADASNRMEQLDAISIVPKNSRLIDTLLELIKTNLSPTTKGRADIDSLHN